MAHHRIKSPQKYPFWLKATLILIGLSLLFMVASYGKFILMPLAFSAFFAMLLNPLVEVFERWKLGRAGSILLTLLLVFVVFAGVLSLISAQFIQFSERVPEVTEKLKTTTDQAITFLEETVGISQEEQSEYLQQGINNLIDQSGG